jgi:hypothetical protein
MALGYELERLMRFDIGDLTDVGGEGIDAIYSADSEKSMTSIGNLLVNSLRGEK